MSRAAAQQCHCPSAALNLCIYAQTWFELKIEVRSASLTLITVHQDPAADVLVYVQSYELDMW